MLYAYRTYILTRVDETFLSGRVVVARGGWPCVWLSTWPKLPVTLLMLVEGCTPAIIAFPGRGDADGDPVPHSFPSSVSVDVCSSSSGSDLSAGGIDQGKEVF